jgi:hypothetical protein
MYLTRIPNGLLTYNFPPVVKNSMRNSVSSSKGNYQNKKDISIG